MAPSQPITLHIHPPFEYLYALFALGTKEHYYTMIRECDLEPSRQIVTALDEMGAGLSLYLDRELEYFFDLSGLGYILYKYILSHPELTEVTSLLDVLQRSDATVMAFHIVSSVGKNKLPKSHTKLWDTLQHSTAEMLQLVDGVEFQDPVRRERVIESLRNPEETKQRFCWLLTEVYTRCYAPLESRIMQWISGEQGKYQSMLDENPSAFMEQYMNLEASRQSDLHIHLSFFKYISWHHYSLYTKGESPDWFILGVYSDQLFRKDIFADKYSSFFKALSDPNRIEILKLLSQRPWFGQELAEQLQITPATVSYHMSFLQKIGAVTFQRADNRSYYSLNGAKLIKPLEEFSHYFQ